MDPQESIFSRIKGAIIRSLSGSCSRSRSRCCGRKRGYIPMVQARVSYQDLSLSPRSRLREHYQQMGASRKDPLVAASQKHLPQPFGSFPQKSNCNHVHQDNSSCSLCRFKEAEHELPVCESIEKKQALKQTRRQHGRGVPRIQLLKTQCKFKQIFAQAIFFPFNLNYTLKRNQSLFLLFWHFMSIPFYMQY